MTSFEFEISKNLSGVEGTVEGYFAPIMFYGSSAVRRCLFAIEDETNPASDKCIPIIESEFGIGRPLINAIAEYQSQIPGLVTFGTDEDSFPQRSHFGVVMRELRRVDPKLLTPLCKTPSFKSNTRWKLENPFKDISLCFGELSVLGETCSITVDENIPPLKSW